MTSSFSSLAPVVAEPRQRFVLAVIHAPPLLLTSGTEACRPPLLHYTFPPAPPPFCHCPPLSPPSPWAHSWSSEPGSCSDQRIQMSQRNHRRAWSCQKKASYSWRVPLWVRRSRSRSPVLHQSSRPRVEPRPPLLTCCSQVILGGMT